MTIASAIPTLKTTVNATRKKYRASTCVESVDAPFGRSGKSGMYLSPSCSSSFYARLVPVQHNQEAAEYENGQGATQPDHVCDNRAVLSGARIVVIAVEQHLVGQRADPVLRSLDDAQADVAGRVFNAVVVLGEFPFRGHQHDAGGVGELIGLRIVLVLP